MPFIFHSSPDAGAFARDVATHLAHIIRSAIALRGRCVIGLCGGTTPAPAYEALGAAGDIDWSRVDAFLTDERFVPPDAPESNLRLIRSTLLKGATGLSVHAPDTALPIDACVRAYDEELRSLPAADVVVLGMGLDGHVASLFPPLTHEAHGPARATHTTTDRFAVRDRVSVTLPVLLNAHARVVPLHGEEKKRAWDKCANTHGTTPISAIVDRGCDVFFHA